MVNVNELKIGEFYKFIIEEVVDEEKKIVDVMEIVGYYTGKVRIWMQCRCKRNPGIYCRLLGKVR